MINFRLYSALSVYGEENVQKTIDQIEEARDFAISDGFVFWLALIAVLLFVGKWLKGRIADQAEIDAEVKRQNAELLQRLDELGYDENGNDVYAKDQDNEEYAVIVQRRNSGSSGNERIRTGRVSSRHKNWY